MKNRVSFPLINSLYSQRTERIISNLDYRTTYAEYGVCIPPATRMTKTQERPCTKETLYTLYQHGTYQLPLPAASGTRER